MSSRKLIARTPHALAKSILLRQEEGLRFDLGGKDTVLFQGRHLQQVPWELLWNAGRELCPRPDYYGCCYLSGREHGSIWRMGVTGQDRKGGQAKERKEIAGKRAGHPTCVRFELSGSILFLCLPPPPHQSPVGWAD